jgi:hypothetical protein
MNIASAVPRCLAGVYMYIFTSDCVVNNPIVFPCYLQQLEVNRPFYLGYPRQISSEFSSSLSLRHEMHFGRILGSFPGGCISSTTCYNYFEPNYTEGP